ncbi:MAG: NAD-dependent epimerase/dehydratase family protein [Cyclobacteriaceae bacterium]
MSENSTNILITGSAGFIGFHLCKRLCLEGYQVTGLDNLNDYYDVDLKLERTRILKERSNFEFVKIDLNDDKLKEIFSEKKFDYVINLAAQAGVRHSIEEPDDYVYSNISGFVRLIECCKKNDVKHFLYASSSSVYGANKNMPFSAQDDTDHPMSLYAASKKSNEMIAHAYASLFQLPVTGLRFFSVYGPYGRPDMALFKFTKGISEGTSIDVYNHGKMKRSFTYVDDVTECISRLLDKTPTEDTNWDGVDRKPNSSYAPFRVLNIGNDEVIELMDYIKLIEKELSKQGIFNMLPMQPGDIAEAKPELSELKELIGYRPNTSIASGVKSFIDWYKNYYNI